MNDYVRRLQMMTRQGRGGFGGMPGGGRGIGSAIGAFALFTGGVWFYQNGLFNVDGGHRAIKYRRISGVSKEIYSEGKAGLPSQRACWWLTSSQERI